MSRCTTSSSKRRPIRRLIAYNVFDGFVTAWRLADWPTSTWSSFVKATIDGVVRSPSEFSMTLGLSPSITATHELVVPRSIPITLPIVLRSKIGEILQTACKVGPSARLSSLCRHDHHSRPQQPTIERVAFLHHGDDGTGLKVL